MSYLSNAAKGLKMMFWAQIVSIFAAVFSAIPLIGVIGSCGTAVCYLITIAGVYVAGKDDEGFKKAFILTIVSLVFSVIAVILGLIPLIGGILSSIISVLTSIFGLIVKFYIITTIAGVLRKIGANDVADRGRTVWWIVMLCTVARAALSLISLIPVINLLAPAFSAMIAIVEIIGTILYLIYLYKSYKALGA